MKNIELYRRSDASYGEVCAFASDIYRRQLAFDIANFPEYFLALRDEAGITGCVGLNSTLSSALFLNDERIVKARRKLGSDVQVCEQSIFALEHYAAGIPILIACVAEYAGSLGARKLVYAGSPTFRKVIERIGFDVSEWGSVDLSVLPSSQRQKYELWNQTQHPVVCMLDTANAADVASAVLWRHKQCVKKGGQLIASLYENHTHLHHKKAA